MRFFACLENPQFRLAHSFPLLQPTVRTSNRGEGSSGAKNIVLVTLRNFLNLSLLGEFSGFSLKS